ncbi:hypothetical protein EK904_012169 [Melospiza melodia maxima]|nr:hypothetical protein EK904_012169 [Melospiza melodia maxima]
MQHVLQTWSPGLSRPTGDTLALCWEKLLQLLNTSSSLAVRSLCRLWGSTRGEPCPGGSWCAGSDSYTAGNGSKQLRACEPEAVPYLCCSLSAPCMEQGSNAEREPVFKTIQQSQRGSAQILTVKVLAFPIFDVSLLLSNSYSVIAGDTVFVPGAPEEPALRTEGEQQFSSELLPKYYNSRGSKFFLHTNMQKPHYKEASELIRGVVTEAHPGGQAQLPPLVFHFKRAKRLHPCPFALAVHVDVHGTPDVPTSVKVLRGPDNDVLPAWDEKGKEKAMLFKTTAPLWFALGAPDTKRCAHVCKTEETACDVSVCRARLGTEGSAQEQYSPSCYQGTLQTHPMQNAMLPTGNTFMAKYKTIPQDESSRTGVRWFN